MSICGMTEEEIKAAAGDGWRGWHEDILTDEDVPWMSPSYERGFRDALKWVEARGEK